MHLPAAAMLLFSVLNSATPAAIVLAPAPAAQASQTTTLRQADARVAAVAFRLAVAGAPFCPASYPQTGIVFHHLAEYLPADRPLMVSRYGLDRGPGVLTVLGGSPAAAAGLQAGDVLLGVNGQPFPSPEAEIAVRDAAKWRPLAEAGERQLEDALRLGPAKLDVLRQGSRIVLTLGSIPGCFGHVRLARNPQVNAFSNGHDVVVTTAMLDYVQSDDELALIIGHELAHFILGHPPMHTGDKLLASVGIRSETFWQREAAADRLAIRLMAAAGYDLDAIIPFWRRFLGKYDTDPQIFRYHPSLGARERIAREEIAAIRAGAAKPR
jgi:membrane-associated protease RseP (regulator of RpoE activity)